MERMKELTYQILTGLMGVLWCNLVYMQEDFGQCDVEGYTDVSGNSLMALTLPQNWGKNIAWI